MSEAYEFLKWSAEFQDRAREKRYFQYDLDRSRRGVRNGMLFVIGAFALATFLDIANFKGELAIHLPYIFALRGFAIASCITVLFIVRNTRSPAILHWTIAFWGLVIGSTFMFVALRYLTFLGRSDSLYWYAIAGCLIAALFPVAVRFSTLAAAGFVLPGLFLHTVLAEPTLEGILRAIFVIAVSGILGYTIGRRLNLGRRFDFSRVDAEQKLNSLLEDEVVKRTAAETEARQHADSLETQLIQSQKMEAIGRLAGGLAHDINNVLTPIMGYTDLIRLEITPDDKNYEAIIQVSDSAVRAKELISKLLAFSRKQVLKMKTVDLCSTVSSLEVVLRRLIREDIDIDIVGSDEPCTLIGDVIQLEQVILNLAINASDAMPHGGKLTIEVGPKYVTEDAVAVMAIPFTGPAVRLQVTDSGVGIKEEHLENIFEPFFTTKEPDKGTGLGLSTVYGIVRQHEGAVFVNSQESKGTTFTLYFPHREADGAPEVVKSDIPESIHQTGTILLVEDEENVRNLTKQMLEQTGYKVYAATNADEAKVLFDAFKDDINLLLTDVVMPGKGGKELIELLRKDCPGLKVLFVSGYSDDVLEERGILDGSAPCLRKPFTLPHLRQQVMAAMRD